MSMTTTRNIRAGYNFSTVGTPQSGSRQPSPTIKEMVQKQVDEQLFVLKAPPNKILFNFVVNLG